MILALTGATGFVGGHLLNQALAAGHRVRALTRRERPPRDGVTWIAGTLGDPAALLGSIRHPAQMYPVGLLFGLGFDTATEVTLLVLAGTGAAAGLPWYAILVLPLLFTAGMTLFDTIDGAFMTAAYRWAFAQPVRRLFYNFTTTGLAVRVVSAGEVSAGVVLIVQVKLAGVGSTLPAASVARTATVWLPSPRPL